MSLDASSTTLPKAFAVIAGNRHLLVPMSLLSLLIVLVVPMPPIVLDMLLSANISLAAIILLTAVYLDRPLQFSVFPSLLLGTTLFRLVLNVATTRLILNADATSPAEATRVAGRVIETFGTFVSGSSIIVGVIIFLILIVVQFVVITKGATRMSEVAARFTLDAMPGKQMAIDADLSAGLIDEQEARTRREQVTREADFYGAMDGASKFVRGDAVAGIIITIVNIVGGFAIGAIEKGWSMSESASVFTRLTIGDGLASQIPSFIIAIAAGLIVARTGGEERLGDEIPRQLSSRPVALYLIAGFLSLLALTPLPSLPLMASALVLVTVARSMGHIDRDRTHQAEQAARAEAAAVRPEPTPIDQLISVDSLEIEIGYGLVSLAHADEGGVIRRITAVRRELASELGIVVPPVRVHDNIQLPPNDYRVMLRGSAIGRGTVHPDLLMAMDAGLASDPIDGIPGTEPAYGLPVRWIRPEQKHQAEARHYTVVDAASVMATHFSELARGHADELLTREEVAQLVEKLKASAPKLVEETIPGVLKPGDLQKVMQHLLRERVPVRDLETIVETAADWAPHTKDPSVLTEYVRNALRRTIVDQHATIDEQGRQVLHCITLDPDLESLVGGYVERGPSGTAITMPPKVAHQITSAVATTAMALVNEGHDLVILTAPSVRGVTREVLETQGTTAAVLAYNEIPRGVRVESVGTVRWSPQEVPVGV